MRSETCTQRRALPDPRRRKKVWYLSREKGQGLLEYGLILVLVAVVVVAALALLGPPIADALQKVIDGLK